MIDGHPAHPAETQALGLQWLAARALRAIAGVKDDGFHENSNGGCTTWSPIRGIR